MARAEAELLWLSWLPVASAQLAEDFRRAIVHRAFGQPIAWRVL